MAQELNEYTGPTYGGPYYDIDEVDAVLAEKDAEIAELQMKLAATQQVLRLNKPKALYSDLETMGRLKNETDVVARRERHHKYKRCLAMEKMCESEEKRLEAISPIFDTDKECWEYNSDYWARWHKRWLELAEKFKEALDQ